MRTRTSLEGIEGRSRRVSFFSVMSWHRALAILCAELAFGAALANADVVLVEQRRVLTTFAMIDIQGGEDPFCSEQRQSTEQGVYDDTEECLVEHEGSQAYGTASQLSYVTPQMLLAEGSMHAEAEVVAPIEFAEGFGSSEYEVVFYVDEPTEAHFQASLFGEGDGVANLVFRVRNGTTLIYRSLRNGSENIDQEFLLEPGNYLLHFQINGFGQAIGGQGSFPANASFSGSLLFPGAASAPDRLADAAANAPRALPNPMRDRTRILPAAGRGEISIVDLAGRVIRRYRSVGAAGIVWDARDENGRLVAPGIYLASGGAGPAARIVLLR